MLTDKGLVPIEAVTKEHRLWDGESWVRHEGVVFKGECEVIEYEGLRATPNHLVWIEGEQKPVQLGIAAACGAHLIQTGDGGRAIWMGRDYQCGKTLEQGNEPLLCSDQMPRLWKYPMAESKQPYKWEVKRMPAVFPAKADTEVVGQTTDSCKTEVRKSECPRISQLRSERDTVRISKYNRGGTLSFVRIWDTRSEDGTGQEEYQWELCQGKSQICNSCRKCGKQKGYRVDKVRTKVLAILPKRSSEETVCRYESGRDYPRCEGCSFLQKEKLAHHQRTARLYDIRNAGRHHRFTVSGKLVHNCGYGGSSGALKAMGALEAGMTEGELQPLVDSWRAANPNIVQLWRDVDHAAKECIKKRMPTETHGICFNYQSGMMFITLPSGRRLAYVKPRIGENRFGGESVTYMGVGSTKKWERLETFGGKLVENIVQGIARDILCYAMQTLKNCAIVAHIHDEIIIEADKRMSVEAVCEQMSRTPSWAKGLKLRADGYECMFYQKD